MPAFVRVNAFAARTIALIRYCRSAGEDAIRKVRPAMYTSRGSCLPRQQELPTHIHAGARNTRRRKAKRNKAPILKCRNDIPLTRKTPTFIDSREERADISGKISEQQTFSAMGERRRQES